MHACVSIRSSNRLQTWIVNNFSLFDVLLCLRYAHVIQLHSIWRILSRCHQIQYIRNVVGPVYFFLCVLLTLQLQKVKKNPNQMYRRNFSFSDWDWLQKNCFWHWYLITLGPSVHRVWLRNYATNKQKRTKNHTTSTMSNDHNYWNWCFYSMLKKKKIMEFIRERMKKYE